MRLTSKSARLGGVAVLAGCCALMAFANLAAAAGSTTITFKQAYKGSTSRYVDVAPKTSHQFEASPGDELVGTNRLEAGGKKIGHMRIVCFATEFAKVINARFTCIGTFVLSGQGTLALSASAKSGTKTATGAIVGGTGTYAGARGTFTSTAGKNSSNTTVTLFE